MTESQISFVDEITNWKTTSLESFLVYNTPSNWNDFFKIDEVKRELSKISIYLEQFTDQIIYPEIVNIFRSLYLSDPSSIKAIILGQDPYHNGSAIGLAFSVKRGNHVNPSLLNIYRELKRDGIIPLSEDGDLHHWASQGILLLNTSLTVTKGNPCIHIKIWNRFTEITHIKQFPLLISKAKLLEQVIHLLFQQILKHQEFLLLLVLEFLVI
jgi:uracil-DNA glycosylase